MIVRRLRYASMNDRNVKSSATGTNLVPEQRVSDQRGVERLDRPTRGALHPAHGTIQAPIVVIGATGTIGSALVRQLVGSGQPVVAVSPHAERLDELRAAFAP